MSFLTPGMFDGVYEPKAVPEGEYQLRIINAEIKASQKTGGNYLNVTMEIIDDAEAKNINHIMMFPTPADDKKKTNSRLFAIQNFLKAFDADISGSLDAKDLIGNTGWAILRVEEDQEYGERNTVRKFVLPK